MSDLFVTALALSEWLDRPDAPLVIDVRKAAAFLADPERIGDAQWRDPYDVGRWGPTLPRDRDVVVYCVHGHEVSRGVRDLLQSFGYRAWYLAAGIDGWKKRKHFALPTAVRREAIESLVP